MLVYLAALSIPLQIFILFLYRADKAKGSVLQTLCKTNQMIDLIDK